MVYNNIFIDTVCLLRSRVPQVSEVVGLDFCSYRSIVRPPRLKTLNLRPGTVSASNTALINDRSRESATYYRLLLRGITPSLSRFTSCNKNKIIVNVLHFNTCFPLITVYKKKFIGLSLHIFVALKRADFLSY